MNWEAIGAVGEVLGAVAVVATLLYVSRQIREQSRALTTSVRDSAFQQLAAWNYQLVADEKLSHLFQRGAATDEWGEFSPEERSRLIHVFYSFFKVFENVYLHTEEGSAHHAVWEQNCQVFFAYASKPGCRRYWTQREASLDPRFVQVLRSMESQGLKTGLEMSGS